MKSLAKIKAALIVMTAAVLLAMSLPPAAFAAEPEEKLLRVGYMDYAGFIERGADGAFTGYGADYLGRIAGYTGYKYEYVYGQWTELLEKLENKEIDLLCNAQYTPERAERFDYSACPIGYTQGLLYTRPESELCYEDHRSFNGLRVGAIRGSAINELFLSYAQRNGFSCELIEYADESALLKALGRGETDAICSEHLANLKDLSLIASFGADAYYIISYKDSPYMEDINYALSEIKTDVDFEAKLYHTYYDSSSAESTAQFTTEQRDYIAGAGTLTVGIMRDRSPIAYRDENGEPAGMVVDLMNIIAARSGLHFRYSFLSIGQTGYDFLSNGGGDMVAGVGASTFAAVNPALLQSAPLMEATIVFVGRKGMDFSTTAPLTAAIPADFINGESEVSAQYPSFKFYNAGSNTDCLNAIRDGKADVMLQNMYVIRECLQSPLYEDLAIFPAYSFPENEIVVALPKNELLISAINKTMDTITDEQTNGVIIGNTIAKSYYASAGELAYKYRIPLTLATVLLAAVIGLLLAITVLRHRSYRAAEAANRKLEASNAQLAEAVVQADRASTAKSQFLSRMSHEIRTPMNAIMELTAIARRHEDDAQRVDDYLSKMETSSKVLLSIINDVLDMSAIESGKLKLANEEFDIGQVLGGIAAIYCPQCESKGISFSMSTGLENERFRGDSLRVSQVLLNLVSNAYKFTGPGGAIRIDAKQTARRENTAFIRFTVSDSGEGMSEDMLARLFKPFEQEAAGTAQKHGGSGLGLSITKNLVDMMHGAICASSEKGIGTEFTVDLPFELAGGSCDISTEQPPAEGTAAHGYDFSGRRVLLAEDDALNTEIAAELLSMVSLPVDHAENGEQAVQLFNASAPGTYDAILMDIQMPMMNGYEAARAIRALPRPDAAAIPIFAMTANAFTDDVSQALSAGMNGHIAKPIDTALLYRTLYEAFKTKTETDDKKTERNEQA